MELNCLINIEKGFFKHSISKLFIIRSRQNLIYRIEE